jgi:nucleoid-associated protein YejK
MGKAERRAARETVAAYHEAQLAALAERILAAGDRYRAGEIDVHTLDEEIHQYHRAAQELWKFCWSGSGMDIEFAASLIERPGADQRPVDWWERGAPRRGRRR